MIGNIEISTISVANYLGVSIYSNLSFYDNIDQVSSRLSSSIGTSFLFPYSPELVFLA